MQALCMQLLRLCAMCMLIPVGFYAASEYASMDASIFGHRGLLSPFSSATSRAYERADPEYRMKLRMLLDR